MPIAPLPNLLKGEMMPRWAGPIKAKTVMLNFTDQEAKAIKSELHKMEKVGPSPGPTAFCHWIVHKGPVLDGFMFRDGILDKVTYP